VTRKVQRLAQFEHILDPERITRHSEVDRLPESALPLVVMFTIARPLDKVGFLSIGRQRRNQSVHSPESRQRHLVSHSMRYSA